MDADTRGIKTRREVLGDVYVDRATADGDPFTTDFQTFITRYAWGDVWSRPGLDRRTRSAITIAMLAALGSEDELATHIRAALGNGLTLDEIKEVLLQVTVYAGCHGPIGPSQWRARRWPGSEHGVLIAAVSPGSTPRGAGRPDAMP